MPVFFVADLALAVRMWGLPSQKDNLTLSSVGQDLTVSSCAGKKSVTMRNATDLRQKVLQASLALIEEGGLNRLSMREVARKSGVSHQAPYYYFGDREAILAAIAGEGFSKLGRSFLRAVDQLGPTG